MFTQFAQQTGRSVEVITLCFTRVVAHARRHGGTYYICDLSDLASLSLDFLDNRMPAVDASDKELHIVICIDMIH